MVFVRGIVVVNKENNEFEAEADVNKELHK